VKKSFLAFLITIGTVIGSGFLSGKEIVVFFSRFGKFSYLCIGLAFFLFWGIFYFMFNAGEKALNRLNKSKFSTFFNIAICFTLSSAMFAGCFESVSFAGNIGGFLIMAVVVAICFYITKHGLGVLEKINVILVPIMIAIIIICESPMLSFKNFLDYSSSIKYAGIFYAVFYVLLNASNSSVLLAHLGGGLTKRQKARVSFCSALVLCLILLLTNSVLLSNAHAFNEDMPLLSLFTGSKRILMQIVILFGCITTLFSLVFTLSRSLGGLIKSEGGRSIITVVTPFAISFVGFGRIVAYFYPISSVLGGALLIDLFLLPFFKQAYKTIHSRRKQAK